MSCRHEPRAPQPPPLPPALRQEARECLIANRAAPVPLSLAAREPACARAPPCAAQRAACAVVTRVLRRGAAAEPNHWRASLVAALPIPRASHTCTGTKSLPPFKQKSRRTTNTTWRARLASDARRPRVSGARLAPALCGGAFLCRRPPVPV
ncbi:MAG: hypothetical protein J3K34DRAFT_63887 [Monoraphidium minutum]|nr:MAG: hypothetical protein J3K34DRAFT_63887 [Monoraphidium minutum]